jgi:hypothetical protein
MILDFDRDILPVNHEQNFLKFDLYKGDIDFGLDYGKRRSIRVC